MGEGNYIWKKTTDDGKSFFDVECYFILTGQNDSKITGEQMTELWDGDRSISISFLFCEEFMI